MTRKGRSVGWATIAVALFTTPLAADTGDHWCDRGFTWTTSSIPVVIHPDLAENLWHTDASSTPWTDSEVRYEVEFVLERLQDQSGAAIPRMYFAGFESASTSWDDPAPGSTHIALRPNFGRCKDETINSPGHADGVLVFFGPSPTCPHRWEHHLDYDDTSKGNFGARLLHELIHTLGFAHGDTGCNPDPVPCTGWPAGSYHDHCSTMQPTGLQSEEYYLEYSEAMALRGKYGAWTNVNGAYQRESLDANSWYNVNIPGPTGISSNAFAAASWANGASYLPMLFSDWNMYPRLKLWDRSTNWLYDWGIAWAAEQFAPVGVSFGQAPNNSLYYYAFFTSPQAETYTVKEPYHTSYLSASQKYSYTSNFTTPRAGHSGAYDPRRKRLIHVALDSDNAIVLSHSSATGQPASYSTPVALSGASNKAAYVPSVACGPDNQILNTDNCVLVWASAADPENEHYHVLKWTQFRLDYVFPGYSWQFNNPVYTIGYIQFGPPQVTYGGPWGASDAFVLTFKNPGRCFYTMRKANGPTDPFGNLKSHCADSSVDRNANPFVGTNPDGWTEAWVVNR